MLSAFRLYRTGADTTNFENKLVNWWTALESLAKGAGGSSKIAEAVETSVTPVLMGVSIANRLRWHLQRIWRARCDIVHSAGRMVNIASLCANLEAYLKAVLTTLLAAFGRIPTLASPQEFFIRADHCYAGARERLATGDACGLKGFLMELKPQ